MKVIMVKKLLRYILINSLKNYTNEEVFLSKSVDHYDLDYRIKYLDSNNQS